jgi:hypothetical protein
MDEDPTRRMANGRKRGMKAPTPGMKGRGGRMRNGGSEVAPCQQPVGGRDESPALLCSALVRGRRGEILMRPRASG